MGNIFDLSIFSIVYRVSLDLVVIMPIPLAGRSLTRLRRLLLT